MSNQPRKIMKSSRIDQLKKRMDILEAVAGKMDNNVNALTAMVKELTVGMASIGALVKALDESGALPIEKFKEVRDKMIVDAAEEVKKKQEETKQQAAS